MDGLTILLTNDDGIDAPGLAALYEELTGVGDVTVVAPADNQSGVGRTRSQRANRESHPWGHVVEGTPADCVAYGHAGLDTDFDVVVSGANHGPNAGNYVFGRSGTVGACIEGAFLGTPGIAISAYHARDFFVDPPEEYDFGRPARVARELLVRACSAAVFETVDVLNVNVPIDVTDAQMVRTEPYPDYDATVEHDPDGDADMALKDVVWPDTVGFENPFPPTDDYRERYPVGSDRRALIEGEISVSPLAAPTMATDTAAVDGVVEAFNANR